MTNDTKVFVLDVLLAEAFEQTSALETQFATDPSSIFVFDGCDRLAKLYAAAAELSRPEGQSNA